MAELASLAAQIGSIFAPLLPFPWNIIATIGLQVAATALQPKSKAPTTDLTARQERVTTLVRSSTEPRRIVYGEALISGPLTLVDVPGPANGNFFGTVPLTTHEVEEIGLVRINDAWENLRAGDGVAFYKHHATDGPFSVYGGTAATGVGLYSLYRHTGADDQAADSILVAQVSDNRWTTEHRKRGCAYLGVRILSDPGVWGGGLPDIRALVRGRKLYDPRQTAVSIVNSVSMGTAAAVFNTSSAHNLSAGDRVFIIGHTGSSPRVQKEFQVATVPSSTSFTLLTYGTAFDAWGETLALTTGGFGGTVTKMIWSDNAALCVADYMWSPFGFNVDDDEIDTTTSLTSAANSCDEFVTLTTTSDEFTVRSTADDIMQRAALEEISGHEPVPIRRGDRVTVSSDGSLPTGLSAGTNYYYIPAAPVVSSTDDGTAGKISYYGFQLATSLANARAGTAIDITSSGSGTMTINRIAQPRYTCNGVVTLDRTPLQNRAELLSSMMGVAPLIGGAFNINAGVSRTESRQVDFDGGTQAAIGNADLVEHLAGPITVRQIHLPRQDLFNAVRGTFTDPDQFWRATDFPMIRSDTFKAADGGELITRDIELPFTNDVTAAQRLAKIALLNARTNAYAMTIPMNLAALRFSVYDLFQIYYSTLDLGGSQSWMVSQWKFNATDEQEPYRIDVDVVAYSTGDYSWSAGEAEAPHAPRTLVTIDGTFTGAPNISLSDDTVTTRGGSDSVSRLIVEVVPTTDAAVTGYQVQYMASGDSDWKNLGFGAAALFYQPGVEPGEIYSVRARSVLVAGGTSDWSATKTIEITATPAGSTLWDSITGTIDTWTGTIDSQ